MIKKIHACGSFCNYPSFTPHDVINICTSAGRGRFLQLQKPQNLYLIVKILHNISYNSIIPIQTNYNSWRVNSTLVNNRSDLIMTTDDSKNNNFKPGLTPDQASKMFDMWSEVLKLPTIGPMYAFTRDFNTYANEFVSLGKIMADMKTHMDQYWSMINAAYTKASKETAERAPKQFLTKDDFDGYRKAMIEAFEDAFTGLYASPEFSQVYGKLFSSQLDMSRAMQTITERNFKALNLPTRGEMDEILKDIHELKRSVRDLKRSLEKQ
ncbi:hypothetical protein NWT39_01450 [Nitrososphaera viennensis]|nr:hypothetical protein NWT39_01450 [Nitrososphaera viennensis]